jgi:hypothetical protein
LQKISLADVESQWIDSEKIKSYEKRFKINKTDRANLCFFAVESMGAFGKEAIKLCKFLAEFGDESCYSVSLDRIYQRLSVGMTDV